MKAMRGEDSTEGKSPRGSVLDRPTLTTAERQRRFAQRKKLRQLGKPGDEEAQQDENLLAEVY